MNGCRRTHGVRRRCGLIPPVLITGLLLYGGLVLTRGDRDPSPSSDFLAPSGEAVAMALYSVTAQELTETT